MSVIHPETKMVRMLYKYQPYAYFYVDFGDIDLSKVKSIKAANWCHLLITMEDGTEHQIETEREPEADLDYKRGFELNALLDENGEELTTFEPTE